MPFEAQSYTTKPILFACGEPMVTFHAGRPELGTISDINMSTTDIFAPSLVSATAVFGSHITMEVVIP